jgi:hypothetical protein
VEEVVVLDLEIQVNLEDLVVELEVMEVRMEQVYQDKEMLEEDKLLLCVRQVEVVEEVQELLVVMVVDLPTTEELEEQVLQIVFQDHQQLMVVEVEEDLLEQDQIHLEVQVVVDKEQDQQILDHQDQLTRGVVAEEDLMLHLKQVEMVDQV